MLGAGPVVAQTEADQSALREPPVRIIGFADFDYDTTDVHGKQGFSLGQAVAHLVAPLGDRLNLFSEISATAHDSDYSIEVERLIVKYDFSDRNTLSAGRFHTPIGYWNTAYHHGAWLQTSIGRPESVKFGSQLVPIHFVGLLFEGEFPGDRGFGYNVGIGNGRHSNIARAGDAGDINDERAWTALGFYQPRAIKGLKAGLGVYSDRVTPPNSVEVDETIYSAYFALERETPEIIAEYHHSDHDARTGPAASGSADSAYVQFAYRLGGDMQRLKPYLRAEKIDVDATDPLLSGLGLDYDGAIAGLRFDFAPYAALKFEYRDEKFGDLERENSFLVQLSVVLARQ